MPDDTFKDTSADVFKGTAEDSWVKTVYPSTLTFTWSQQTPVLPVYEYPSSLTLSWSQQSPTVVLSQVIQLAVQTLAWSQQGPSVSTGFVVEVSTQTFAWSQVTPLLYLDAFVSTGTNFWGETASDEWWFITTAVTTVTPDAQTVTWSVQTPEIAYPVTVFLPYETQIKDAAGNPILDAGGTPIYEAEPLRDFIVDWAQQTPEIQFGVSVQPSTLTVTWSEPAIDLLTITAVPDAQAWNWSQPVPLRPIHLAALELAWSQPTPSIISDVLILPSALAYVWSQQTVYIETGIIVIGAGRRGLLVGVY